MGIIYVIALDKRGAISYYKTMKAPISKSQTRAMKLAGLASVDSYEVAAVALETAGYRKDGIPQGQTWRTAAKLSDADLIAGITIVIDFDDLAASRIEY
jgi:hypothetical protein